MALDPQISLAVRPVDITAQPGAGNLLGNLLGGLSHLLDSNANTNALVNKLDKIAGEITALL